MSGGAGGRTGMEAVLPTGTCRLPAGKLDSKRRRACAAFRAAACGRLPTTLQVSTGMRQAGAPTNLQQCSRGSHLLQQPNVLRGTSSSASRRRRAVQPCAALPEALAALQSPPLQDFAAAGFAVFGATLLIKIFDSFEKIGLIDQVRSVGTPASALG